MPSKQTHDLPDSGGIHQFMFERDSFAFPNELFWEYVFDQTTGKTKFSRRQPSPTYAHRCFVLVKAARQFLNHARFDPQKPKLSELAWRQLIRETVSRNPRTSSTPDKCVVFPGYSGLREFSAAHEPLLKAECGAAWKSYFLRSHWRMVFPISRKHQADTTRQLVQSVLRRGSAVIHLVRFPALTINHGMLVFGFQETKESILFSAYDPNDPAAPTLLQYDKITREFLLQKNRYWAGGRVDIIQLYESWMM